MKFNTFDDFYNTEFSNVIVPTLDEFKNTYKHNGKIWYNYLKDISNRFSEDDIRRYDIDAYFILVYDFMWKNHKNVLQLWWNSHCSYERDLPKFYTNTNIISYDIIDGKYNAKLGRPVKNLCYKGIFDDCSKSNSRRMSSIGFLKGFYKDKQTHSSQLFTRMVTSIMQKNDYETFFAIMRGTMTKNSVFNPYTYSYILNNILPLGKRILNPVMSWCVPIIAFHNSNYIDMIGIDVIPNVVDISTELHKEYNESKTFLEEQKTCKIYLCPSEDIDEKHAFCTRYNNYFDTVFFSPPYYDLEQYVGGEQSWEKFKTYEDWLEGYWRKTVELCHKTLKPGGTFSFVIVKSYGVSGNVKNISDDMLKISQEYFTLDKTMELSWGGFSTSIVEKRKNLLEDLHIMRK